MIPLEVPPTRLKILFNFALFFSNFLHIYIIIDIDREYTSGNDIEKLDKASHSSVADLN